MPTSFRITGLGASPSLIVAVLVATTSYVGCEKSEARPRPGAVPATSAGTAGETSPVRVGEPARVNDLEVVVEEVEECTPRGYERAAVDQAGAVLLGVRVSIERAAATGSQPPARYEGAPRMLLEDAQGRQYRYTLRGTCTPELRGANLQAGNRLRGWVTFQIPATAKDLTLVYPVDARTHGHPEWIKEPGIARDVRPQPEDAGVASDGAAATGGMTGRAEAGTTASTPGPARFSLGR